VRIQYSKEIHFDHPHNIRPAKYVVGHETSIAFIIIYRKSIRDEALITFRHFATPLRCFVSYHEPGCDAKKDERRALVKQPDAAIKDLQLSESIFYFIASLRRRKLFTSRETRKNQTK